MRKIREMLRLKFEVGLSARQIAVSLQVGRATIGDYLNRFAASGLIWPCTSTDAELQRRLFPPPPAVPSEQRPLPDWAWAPASPSPCSGKSTDSPKEHACQVNANAWATPCNYPVMGSGAKGAETLMFPRENTGTERQKAMPDRHRFRP